MSVRESVLEALENNRGTYLSGEKLSEQLGVSRAAVWKAIRRLREEGYPIDAVTGSGYALPKVSRQVTEEEVRRYLPAKYRNNSLYIYDILDSTNLRARQIALEGDSPSKGRPAFGNDPGRIHGTAVIAAQQTAGRGRLGRSFFSPKEGLYLSVIIKPDFDLSASVLGFCPIRKQTTIIVTEKTCKNLVYYHSIPLMVTSALPLAILPIIP